MNPFWTLSEIRAEGSGEDRGEQNAPRLACRRPTCTVARVMMRGCSWLPKPAPEARPQALRLLLCSDISAWSADTGPWAQMGRSGVGWATWKELLGSREQGQAPGHLFPKWVVLA